MAGTGRRQTGGIALGASIGGKLLEAKRKLCLSEDSMKISFYFLVGMGSCLVGAPCSVISAWVGCKVNKDMCGG